MRWILVLWLYSCGGSTSSIGDLCSDNNDCQEAEVCDVTSSGVCEEEEVCGNGHVETDEECDDGELASGDGCDSTCFYEKVPSGAACEVNAQCQSDICIASQCITATPSVIPSSNNRAIAIDHSTKTLVLGNQALGHAEVYVWGNETWQLQDTLQSANWGALHAFGVDVDISGDTLVVGASSENGDADSTMAMPNENAVRSGAAYVFVRSGETWSQQAYLKASNAEENDNFGMRVRIDGDRIVVSTGHEDGSSSSTSAAPNNDAGSAGAAYVFERNNNAWDEVAYLKAANAEGGDLFGYGLGLSKDTVVVGAPGEDDGTGAVYVFSKNGEAWQQQGYLKSTTPQASDWFGDHLDVENDLIAAGSAGGPEESGVVYLFRRSQGTWALLQSLHASNGEAGDGFGRSVKLNGNAILVGAPNESGDATSTPEMENNNQPYAGAVYLFTQTNTQWEQSAYFKAVTPQSFFAFGTYIALSGPLLASVGLDIGPESGNVMVWSPF